MTCRSEAECDRFNESVRKLEAERDDLLNKVEGAKDELVRMFPLSYLDDPRNRGTIAVMIWKILTEKTAAQNRKDEAHECWVDGGICPVDGSCTCWCHKVKV